MSQISVQERRAPGGARKRSKGHKPRHGRFDGLTHEQLVALEIKSHGSTKRSVPAVAPIECSPMASPDLYREAVRSLAGRIPIYDHPFVGCKVLNLVLTSSTISWSGTIYQPMVTLTQGVADNQRTGDVIRVIGVDIKLRSTVGTAAAPAANAEYQVQLCYSPLASLSITSVYQDVGTAYSGSALEDWDYRAVIKRYARIHSRVDQYHPMNTHSISVRCNEVTNYDSGAATVAYGVWGLACISGENPAAPTEMPSMYGMMQMYYQDV